MNRPKIPHQTETQLLLNCRRRCCICYGLDRDHRIKQGQIVHLNHNRQNNKIENLAFLCLMHHDSYDSRTSQSKGLIKKEVEKFKEELEVYIAENWNQTIVDTGQIKMDFFTGSYFRGDEFESSELEVTFLGGNLIHVRGNAMWGINREYGPHIGQLDLVTEISVNKAVFIDKLFEDTYRLELEFLGDKLKADEDYVLGYFGMSASFGVNTINQNENETTFA